MAKGSGGPRLDCGAKFMKVTLVVFNLIFFILGIVILAIGVYVLVDPSFKQFKYIANVQQLAAENGINITYIDKCGIAFCIFGGVMFLISFMGCCGALKQIKCLLGMYSLVLFAVLLSEIAVGIFVAVYSSKLKSVLTPVLQQSIKDQYMGNMENKTLASIAWDSVMFNFQCCGVNNYTDFNVPNNIWTSRNGSIIPLSCCKFNTNFNDWSGVMPSLPKGSQCLSNPNNINSNYDIGCYEKINILVNQYSGILIGIAIGVGFVLMLGVIFGFYLCRRVSEMEDYA